MRNVPNLITKFDSSDPGNFPDGRFKNDTSPGDNLGSEWIKTFPNDVLQALYGIIRQAGFSPDNVIEKPATSQVVSSIHAWMVRNSICNFQERTSATLTVLRSAVIANANIFVIVGAAGFIETTPDGDDYTQETSGTANDLNDVSHDIVNDIFLTVGNNPTILTAPDPATVWTVRTTGTRSINLEGCDIDLSGNVYLAVGSASAGLDQGHSIEISTDQGVTWDDVRDVSGSIGITPIAPFNDILAKTYKIVVGDQGAIQKSTNNIDWTLQTSGTTESLLSIAYSPTLDRIAVCGTNATIVYSDNGGTTWSTVPAAGIPVVSTLQLNGINWVSEANAFIILCEDGEILISEDAITWIHVLNRADWELFDMAYKTTSGVGLIVGDDIGNDRIMQSLVVMPL